jgi:hydrogenase maturation protein HypF
VECRSPTLAVGGQFKGTFGLGRGRHAFLSHHLGDLDHYEAYQAFTRDIRLYEQLFGLEPRVLVHDLHPDYASTRYASERARETPAERPETRITLHGVQHHHAHVASCMAENGLVDPVIGVAFDGTGYGTDGAIWGGEFLVGDYRSFRRLAHLRYVPMPGGDQAIREPWRMATAYLDDAETDCSLLKSRIDTSAAAAIARMIARCFQTPLTSSAGRLFDAVASVAGVRDRVSYEGQAAVELEWLAMSIAEDGAYPFELVEAGQDAPLIVDTRPLIRAVAEDVRRGLDAAKIARRFHTTMVEAIVTVVDRLRRATGLEVVVLSGGVFMNVLLTTELSARLEGRGFGVYRHRVVPPNDGGLSLGQLAIAAARSAA